MNTELGIALISAIGGIITAVISAYIQIKIAESQAKVTREETNAGSKSENIGKSKKGAQGKKKSPSTVTTPTQEKPKINWYLRLGIVAIIVGFTMFFVITRAFNLMPEPPLQPISLSDAKIEFRIVNNDQQIIIPTGSILSSFHQDDKITIETSVTDKEGTPYPHELTITYYFASGGTFFGTVAPYLVKQSDIITVRIEDQVTGEVITRIMFIKMN